MAGLRCAAALMLRRSGSFALPCRITKEAPNPKLARSRENPSLKLRTDGSGYHASRTAQIWKSCAAMCGKMRLCAAMCGFWGTRRSLDPRADGGARLPEKAAKMRSKCGKPFINNMLCIKWAIDFGSLSLAFGSHPLLADAECVPFAKATMDKMADKHGRDIPPGEEIMGGRLRKRGESGRKRRAVRICPRLSAFVRIFWRWPMLRLGTPKAESGRAAALRERSQASGLLTWADSAHICPLGGRGLRGEPVGLKGRKRRKGRGRLA
jgi:hypothetical protein